MTETPESPRRCPLDPPALRAIVARFGLDTRIGAIQPLGRGLINDTCAFEAGGIGYVLQRINAHVFPDPEPLMTNLAVLRARWEHGDTRGLRLARPLPTREGGGYVRDAHGQAWRVQERIAGGVGLSGLRDLRDAREAGHLLGRFHRILAGVPVARLRMALPGLHDTPAYLHRLDQACAGGPGAACAEMASSLAFVDARRPLASQLAEAAAAGRVPTRATHGDPKLDNMLFSDRDGRGLALIDLDTLQPGLWLHDVADCLRSCCRRGDSPGQVGFALEFAAAILAAYAAETREDWTDGEIELLYAAIRLLPFELGMRFLADHLAGDRYFRVAARGDNLRKARLQFDLVADIERQEAAIAQAIADAFQQPARAVPASAG